MNSCTVMELAEKMSRGDEFLLLDVREEQELALAAIEGALNVGLDELEDRTHELFEWRAKGIVTMCHHGMRSAVAQEILLASRFTNMRKLTGRIDAYAATVDSNIGRY